VRQSELALCDSEGDRVTRQGLLSQTDSRSDSISASGDPSQVTQPLWKWVNVCQVPSSGLPLEVVTSAGSPFLVCLCNLFNIGLMSTY
jgi:hypothetical protein